MKKVWGILLAASLLVSAGCSKMDESKKGADKAAGNKTAQIKLIGAHVNTTDSSYQAGFAAMKKKLEEVSGGKMTVEIHPNGELGGGESELVEKMATGTVDMIVTAPNFIATTGVKEADLFSIPFMFSGQDHWTKVVDGEVGKVIVDKINKAGTFKALGYWSCGTREYFGVKPVTNVADFKGVKIRVHDSETVRSIWASLGANPTNLAYNELYSGLQNHVIDAAENDLGNILLQKFYEAGKYISLTDHDIATRLFIMSGKKYNGLTAEQKKWVDEAAAYACKEERASDKKINDAALGEIKKKGGIINKVNKDEIIATCANARSAAAEKLGVSELYKKITALAK